MKSSEKPDVSKMALRSQSSWKIFSYDIDGCMAQCVFSSVIKYDLVLASLSLPIQYFVIEYSQESQFLSNLGNCSVLQFFAEIESWGSTRLYLYILFYHLF